MAACRCRPMALGVDQIVARVKVGEAHVRLDGHVGLAAHVEIVLHHHVGLVERWGGVIALGDLLT
jgi:hypothetical protein